MRRRTTIRTVPRIRTIKPELLKHEGLFDAAMETQLPIRIAFVGLITCCDREGRFRWQPRRLKSDILPFDDLDMNRVLDVLEERGFVKRYEHQGEWYGYIPSWARHQTINKREAQSVIPAPQTEIQSVSMSILIGEKKGNKILQPAPIQKEKRNSRTLEECVIESELSSKNPNINNGIVVNFDSVSNEDPTVTQSARARTCVHVGKGRERNGKEGNGMERNGMEGERKTIVIAPEARPSSTSVPIQQIFEHWKTVMRHPNAKLDPRRRKLIAKALKFGYSAPQLCQAIEGCSLTPHNIGDNDRNQRFDGLHVILRDADQIDRFMRNYHSPPRRLTEAERRTAANVQVLQEWMFDQMQEDAVYGEH